MGYYVPETLKKLDNWVVWRLEDTGKGKLSKVPYSPKTGRKADTTDYRSWASYEEAVTRNANDDFSGIGFVFTESAGLVFIDIDNCFTDDGEETAFAQEIQALFPSSYSEISQSENGLHIVCKGDLPKAIKRPEIEMYSSGRYMAFTGNAIRLSEPQEGQEGINTLFQKYGLTVPNKALQRLASTEEASEEKVERIISFTLRSRQGAKFERLLEGDWNGYKSQSEADQAFINIAHYFCKGNKALILALWGRCKLSERPKGKRVDYVGRMIENARNTYTGSVTRTKTRRTALVDIEKPKKKRVPVR